MGILGTAIFLLPALINGLIHEMEQKSHYQGDMVLDPDQMRLAKAGKLTFGSIKYRLWPRNIPYDYADSIASRYKNLAYLVTLKLLQGVAVFEKVS